jgi:hypothetical protein
MRSVASKNGQKYPEFCIKNSKYKIGVVNNVEKGITITSTAPSSMKNGRLRRRLS